MVAISIAVSIALIVYVGYRLYQHLFPPPNVNPHAKYVLISGCDSGFGHALAIELDKLGFHVFAGVYIKDNVEHLTGQLSPRATVFSLDITQQDEIDAAYEIIVKKTSILHALVNNAGIATSGFVDWISIESMRQTMDVNFFGHISMTKKFLPLLLARRGSRVINICSIYGFLAGPGLSAYSASKFALEAFSDSLRREMHTWGLHVSIIEPGFMRTPIIEGHETVYRELWSGLDETTRKRWGNAFFEDTLEKGIKSPFISNAENPAKVIKSLRHAIMSTAPRIRYRPGWQSKLFFFPISMLPTWITDLIMRHSCDVNAAPAGIYEQQE